MKNIKILLIVLTVLSLISCKTKIFKPEPVGKIVDINQFLDSKEEKPLAQVYFESGNFINSRDFPPIVLNQEVYSNGNQYIIIDLRDVGSYEEGHINGAYNVDKKDVLNFLKEKKLASATKKVVFVCYTGQIASYVTGITRYSGFNNTYTMLYGMGGWNNEFSTPLKKAFGNSKSKFVKFAGSHKSDGEEHHATVEHEKEVKLDFSKLPKIEKGKITDIIKKRANHLLSLKRPEFLLKADELFSKLSKTEFYPIAYMKSNKYELAHIENAHQFSTRKDLSIDHKLLEIPSDKPVVVYCKSGHTAGHANAYLKMLGYDSYSIILGSSSFMHKLWAEKEWQTGDVSALVNELPVVRGKNRTDKNPFFANSTRKKSATAAKPIKRRKKKAISGGCG
jgi:rhodanese-related sulfurtransferase